LLDIFVILCYIIFKKKTKPLTFKKVKNKWLNTKNIHTIKVFYSVSVVLTTPVEQKRIRFYQEERWNLFLDIPGTQ